MNSRIQTTPVKAVKSRGRPRKYTNCASDFCRICKTNLKINFGNFTKHISTENIYDTNKKRSEGISINDVLVTILNIKIEKSDSFSSRVCSKCALKVRNAGKLYSFLNDNLNIPHAGVDVAGREPTGVREPACVRFKRLSNSPGLKEAKKKQKPCSQSIPVKNQQFQESLTRNHSILDDQSEVDRPVKRALSLSFSREEPQVRKDNDDSELPFANINIGKTVCYNERPKHLEVDVHLHYPSGLRIASVKEQAARNVIKNVAQNNWKAAINVIFKQEDCKPYIQQAIRSSISLEFKEYCHSDISVLKYSSPSELASFSNNLVRKEASVFAPLWSSAVEGALGVSQDEKKKIKATNVFALCTASAARFRNNRMSAFAHRVSTILLHSGAKSMDFMRLNRLGISMSHCESIKKQKEMGKSHDIKVLMWKSEVEQSKRLELFLKEIRAKQVPVLGEDDMELEVTIDTSEDTLKSYDFFSKEVYKELKESIFKNRIITDDELESSIRRATHQGISHPKYRIVADNFDLSIKSRIQTQSSVNQSIHWTHQYAIKDRVACKQSEVDLNPEFKIDELPLHYLLPTAEVQKAFKYDCAVLVSRVICKYLPAFKKLKDVIVYHIPHPFMKEVSSKSDLVCLGLETLNSNKSAEMAKLMFQDQERYVPHVESANGDIAHTEPVFFDGDALTEERARNVQWTFLNGDDVKDCLKGLDPNHTDWHAKVNLYEIDEKMFFSKTSAGDVGSTCASMNRTGKTNAKKGPGADYNAYKDFHDREIEAHIIASFMHFAGMKSIEGQPQTFQVPDSWRSSKEKKAWLEETVMKYLDVFVFDTDEVPVIAEEVQRLEQNAQARYQCRAPNCGRHYAFHSLRVRHEIGVHPELVTQDTPPTDHMDSEGYYKCRNGCGLVYKTKSGRNRHEKQKHGLTTADEVSSSEGTESKENKKKCTDTEDYKYNYHKAKLAYGLLLFDLGDAIREGDGERLFSLYKLALLAYKSHGHTKYAYVTLLLLVRAYAILSKAQAFSLKWNRFCNTSGKIGRNIALDLRLEHLNNLLKACLKSLGSNINEASAKRVAASLNDIELVMQSIDNDCQFENSSKKRGGKDPAETVGIIVKDLMNCDVFTNFLDGREGYIGFETFNGNIITKLDYRDYYNWIKEHLKLWGSIYDKIVDE